MQGEWVRRENLEFSGTHQLNCNGFIAEENRELLGSKKLTITERFFHLFANSH